MSERLQVILDDDEYREVRRAARQKGLSVPEWLRRSLRDTRSAEPASDRGGIATSARGALHVAIMEHDGVTRVLSFDRGFDVLPPVDRVSYG